MLAYIKSYAIILLLELFARLPLGLARTIGRAVGIVNWLLNNRSARVTEINLRLCYPELNSKERSDLARRSLMHTGQMLLETPIVWLRSMEKSRAWIKGCKGESLLLNAIKLGKGVVIVLPHHGNWEMFNVFYQYDRPMVALYNPPPDEVLDRFLSKVRNRMGNVVVPTTRSGLAELYRALKNGGVVTVLPDQIPASGKFAPFFGMQVLTDPLVPRLIARSGATVVCVTILRSERPRGFTVEFSEPDARIYDQDLMVSLSGLNETIENSVRKAPDQYQWEYKRFKVPPEGGINPYKRLPG